MIKINEVDLSWLAGIVDGEGSIMIWRRTNKSRSGEKIISPTAKATITNSNCKILTKCKNILDELGIKYQFGYSDDRNTRLVKRIEIRNYESLKILVTQIKPYLVGKSKQIELLQEFLELAKLPKGTAIRRWKILELMSNENKYGSQFL